MRALGICWRIAGFEVWRDAFRRSGVMRACVLECLPGQNACKIPFAPAFAWIG